MPSSLPSARSTLAVNTRACGGRENPSILADTMEAVIAAVNDAVELRSFQEIIPSMNDIFIRAVGGTLNAE